jgi:hypothetical protein
MEFLRSACLVTPVARRCKSLNPSRHHGSPYSDRHWHTILSVGCLVGEVTIRRSPYISSWSCRCRSLAMF